MFFANCMDAIAYLLSQFFTDPETAVKYTSLITSLGMLLGPYIGFIILGAILGGDSGPEAALGILYFISPLYTFWATAMNFTYMGDEEREKLRFEAGGNVAMLPLALGTLTYQFVLVYALTMYLDSVAMTRYKKRGGEDGKEPPHLEVHDDVKEHEEEVRKAKGKNVGDADYLQIRAENLCKTYSGTKRMAVCRNTFGVKPGEVYGLLGPNGAGKSTTFGMMAMQLNVTSGDAELMESEVKDLDLRAHGKFFGICNQENLMWDEMTVDESLNFVAALKGVRGAQRDLFKKLITQNLDLGFFKNTLAKNLSGGNKRKLCCAQAIMLNPKVLFLDEPTTGVDPVSRRSLNRMIKKMKMASILLTTHRMDEAEQLCDQLAIMVNGRFVVFGSPNYLKNKYGHGYTITMKQTGANFYNQETNLLKAI